ncbi:transcription factor NIGT1-like isoform X2 [Musa acuminata AAA Group]|uniref:transcription factor NIGT1-like isoform X2 n=1 Tax=Musa acuminata AAA Group TaxID=214697 RepID=UPI0031DAAB78
MDLLGRAQRCQDCIRALEEERKKIKAFQRELPLCLHLVTRAIESVRHVMGDDEKVNHGPVTEELIPPMSEQRSEAKKSAAVGSEMKLRSVQLRNQEPDTVPRMEPPKKPIVAISKKIGSAFQPFQRQKYVVPPPASSAATAIPATTDGDGGRDYGSKEGNREKKEEQLQPHRKARRSWSPELHRCFLHALHQLGGSDVATPKQIRELMKVDGLTIDEVKSHLQKYRLHGRRRSPAVQCSSNGSLAVSPQVVLVGGIVVPSPDYNMADAAVAAAAQPANGARAPSNGMYAPVASHPSDSRYQQKQPQRSITLRWRGRQHGG